MRSVEIDVFKYNTIKAWKPMIGDLIYRDSVFFRWWAVILGVNSDQISIRKSGNFRLLVGGDYKDEIIDANKLKSAWIGTYVIISNGITYL